MDNLSDVVGVDVHRNGARRQAAADRRPVRVEETRLLRQRNLRQRDRAEAIVPETGIVRNGR